LVTSTVEIKYFHNKIKKSLKIPKG